jgi:hypothetical protein
VRLKEAERIAAAVVFCNKTAVSLSPSIPDSAPDDVSISELAKTAANTISRDGEELVRETLATGLFSGRGHQLMGFGHRTFAEFLAASYLHNSNLATSERLKFVQHPDDPNDRIVPQLRETAAWLASMDQAIFRAVMR